MSDIQLTQREKEILSIELSKASQNATGGFFSSRDEIQNNLENNFSGEIDSARIDEICNEIISDMYSMGGDVRYNDAKSYLENYDVLLDEPNPVDFGVDFKPKADPKFYIKESSPKNNEAHSPSTEPSDNDPSNKTQDSEDRLRESFEKSNKEKDEKERAKEIEDKAEESMQKSEELLQKAADIRRSMSEKAFMNPYALMGFTFAKMGIITRNIVRNIASSALPGLGWSLSGKSFLGHRFGYNMAAKKHQNNWGKGLTSHENGMEVLSRLRVADNLIEEGRLEDAKDVMIDTATSIQNKKVKFDKKDKPKIFELLGSISEKLKEKDQDNPAVKALKKQVEAINKMIINMIRKLFGMGKNTDHSAPENSGP